MVLDLVDFKDRVRPLSNDVALLEQASKFQKQNVNQMLDERAQFMQLLDDLKAGRDPQSAAPSERLQTAEETDGYSSIEVPEKQQAAVDDTAGSSEADVAEPDLE